MPNAQQLYEQGVLVLRIPYFVENLATLRTEFEQALTTMPEFIKHPKLSEITKEPESRYNIGGTAFIGNPSVFHNMFSRKLRNDITYYLIHSVLRDYIHTYMPGASLETVIDRFMVRPPLDVPTKESWHRDESPYSLDNDVVFGGWLNLDEDVQKFSCVLATHHENSRRLGFAKIPLDMYDTYNAQKTVIEVPPGHIIIFSENIVHEIICNKSTIKTHTSIKQFISYRITNTTEPLVGTQELEHSLDTQSVCRIKSGQIPRLYPKAAMMYPAQRENKDRFIAEMTIGAEHIDPKTHNFKPLKYIGASYPAYNKQEKSLLYPTQVKLLINPETHKLTIVKVGAPTVPPTTPSLTQYTPSLPH